MRFSILHKQKNAILEAYCDLEGNKWNEEKLGEYRGDAFALTLYYFIMHVVSPYDLHLYSMTAREGKDEEERLFLAFNLFCMVARNFHRKKVMKIPKILLTY